MVHQLRDRPVEEAAAYLQLATRQQRADDLANRVERLGLTQPWSVRWAVWEPVTTHRIVGSHSYPVTTVAVGELDGRPVVVSGGKDQTVRVWDLATGRSVGERLAGHSNGVTRVAVGELDGRPVVVSGGDDNTVRVWDLATGRSVGEPLTGHSRSVDAVAVGELDGRPVVVSGSRDKTVRVWDLATGRPVGEPLTGHRNPVFAVAVGELDGRPVVVSGGSDATVRVWDMHARRVHAIEIGAVVSAIAYASPSHILVATVRGLALMQHGGLALVQRIWKISA